MSAAIDPRGPRRCACGGPCFYCSMPLNGRHEHDHFPRPWRHGGTNTVPACHACHSAKDRQRMTDWFTSARMDRVIEGSDGLTETFLAVLLDCIHHKDPLGPDWISGDLDDVITRTVARCTTQEARIFAARTVCVALDVTASMTRAAA